MLSDDTSVDFDYEDTIQINCQPGYRIIGLDQISLELTCEIDPTDSIVGQWDTLPNSIECTSGFIIIIISLFAHSETMIVSIEHSKTHSMYKYNNYIQQLYITV